MPINPNIALSTRGIELRNPLDQYSKVMAIQNAQQQNALAQQQMRESERKLASTNALNQAYANAYNPETNDYDLNNLGKSLAGSGFGSMIPEAQKKYFESRESKSKALKGEAELFDTSMKQIRNAWGSVRTVEDALAIHNATHKNPVIEKRLRELGVTEEMGRQTIMEAAQNPATFAEFLKRAQLGAEEFIKANKPTTQMVDRSGQKDVIQIPGLGGAPTTVGTYADVPLPENVVAQKARIAAAGAARTNITNVQERAELAARGQMLVDAFKDVNNSAKVAARTLPALEANLATLDKGFKTGFGTEAQTAAASVLAALGVEKAKDFATNSQTFLANASQAVLQRQLEQKGPQTEADAQRITQTGAQLGITPDANRFLLDVAREQLKRDVEQRDFYSRWFTENKTYDGAEDAWFTGEGSKSLFERPVLKKYANPSQAPSAPGKPSLDSIFKGKKP
jgi:hypothetical protein